jgi:hypothetical protein
MLCFAASWHGSPRDKSLGKKTYCWVCGRRGPTVLEQTTGRGELDYVYASASHLELGLCCYVASGTVEFGMKSPYNVPLLLKV